MGGSGQEANFRDMMSQTHCIYIYIYILIDYDLHRNLHFGYGSYAHTTFYFTHIFVNSTFTKLIPFSMLTVVSDTEYRVDECPAIWPAISLLFM